MTKTWKLPKKLRILGRDVSVSLVAKGPMLASSEYGEADLDSGEIRIGDWLCESHARSTLLHEIVHFIDDDLELGMTEEQVGGLAQGLFQVLRDNEKFL